ncbi:hypothetical protein RRG08_017643 [Elysia crispata]|uniref:C-type lectin domain-containing protein n=1 Tax=Elysia crispata TaxID=231223 RepID=A0AAE1DD93_9GAST|nr:hypothetical protein RRG08_017643 [Elysia crispata]
MCYQKREKNERETYSGITKVQGCPEGWLKSKNQCYLIRGRQESFADASKICSSHEATLALIQGNGDARFLYNQVHTGISNDFWVRSKERKCARFDINMPFTSSQLLRNCDSTTPSGYICQKQSRLVEASNVDSNRAGCPVNGFGYRDKCYVINDDPRTYSNAERDCKRYRGGAIASLPNSAVLKYVEFYLVSEKTSLWIGLTKTRDNVYKWPNAEKVTYLPWGPTHTGNEDAQCYQLITGSDSTMVEVASCERARPSLCEISRNGDFTSLSDAVSKPISRNGDFTSLSDAVSKPISRNGDFTSLSDAVSKPISRNGDFTSLSDAVSKPMGELKKCPEDWDQQGDFCFRLFTTPLSWPGAQRECANFNGNLVSQHGPTDVKFLSSILKKTNGDCWIGLRKPSKNKAFEWSDGSPFDFSHWQNDKPASLTEERCVKHFSRWSDVSCAEKLPYVCQVYRGDILVGAAIATEITSSGKNTQTSGTQTTRIIKVQTPEKHKLLTAFNRKFLSTSNFELPSTENLKNQTIADSALKTAANTQTIANVSTNVQNTSNGALETKTNAGFQSSNGTKSFTTTNVREPTTNVTSPAATSKDIPTNTSGLYLNTNGSIAYVDTTKTQTTRREVVNNSTNTPNMTVYTRNTPEATMSNTTEAPTTNATQAPNVTTNTSGSHLTANGSLADNSTKTPKVPVTSLNTSETSSTNQTKSSKETSKEAVQPTSNPKPTTSLTSKPSDKSDNPADRAKGSIGQLGSQEITVIIVCSCVAVAVALVLATVLYRRRKNRSIQLPLMMSETPTFSSQGNKLQIWDYDDTQSSPRSSPFALEGPAAQDDPPDGLGDSSTLQMSPTNMTTFGGN